MPTRRHVLATLAGVSLSGCVSRASSRLADTGADTGTGTTNTPTGTRSPTPDDTGNGGDTPPTPYPDTQRGIAIESIQHTRTRGEWWTYDTRGIAYRATTVQMFSHVQRDNTRLTPPPGTQFAVIEWDIRALARDMRVLEGGLTVGALTTPTATFYPYRSELIDETPAEPVFPAAPSGVEGAFLSGYGGQSRGPVRSWWSVHAVPSALDPAQITPSFAVHPDSYPRVKCAWGLPNTGPGTGMGGET